MMHRASPAADPNPSRASSGPHRPLRSASAEGASLSPLAAEEGAKCGRALHGASPAAATHPSRAPSGPRGPLRSASAEGVSLSPLHAAEDGAMHDPAPTSAPGGPASAQAARQDGASAAQGQAAGLAVQCASPAAGAAAGGQAACLNSGAGAPAGPSAARVPRSAFTAAPDVRPRLAGW